MTFSGDFLDLLVTTKIVTTTRNKPLGLHNLPRQQCTKRIWLVSSLLIMQYMLEAEWWHGPLGCGQCFLVPLVSSPYLLFCVLLWHWQWDEDRPNSRQEQWEIFCLVYRWGMQGDTYLSTWWASMWLHTCTYITFLSIPRHLMCLYWHRDTGMSGFITQMFSLKFVITILQLKYSKALKKLTV